MRNSRPNTGESPKAALKAAAAVRVVVVDDEEIALDLVELFIRDWSKEATGAAASSPSCQATPVPRGRTPARPPDFLRGFFELASARSPLLAQMLRQKQSRSLPGFGLNLPCPVRGERLGNLDRKLNDSGTHSGGCGRHAFTGSRKQPACPKCSDGVPKQGRNTTRAGSFLLGSHGMAPPLTPPPWQGNILA